MHVAQKWFRFWDNDMHRKQRLAQRKMGRAAGSTGGPSCVSPTSYPSAPGASGLFLPGKTD
ncbi:MAG: hypothetical protein E5V65_04855 [Mesorhizobium sp.]|nr:MAG: hypothetical protein E5V65_04855 [Mesorhizobium sp.]